MTIITAGNNQYIVDLIDGGVVYMRPIIDGMACLPGASVDADELRAAIDAGAITEVTK